MTTICESDSCVAPAFLGVELNRCAYVGPQYGHLCVFSFLLCVTVSAVTRQKIQCRPSFCVGPDGHFDQKLATFRRVAEMLATFPAKSQNKPDDASIAS